MPPEEPPMFSARLGVGVVRVDLQPHLASSLRRTRGWWRVREGRAAWTALAPAARVDPQSPSPLPLSSSFSLGVARCGVVEAPPPLLHAHQGGGHPLQDPPHPPLTLISQPRTLWWG